MRRGWAAAPSLFLSSGWAYRRRSPSRAHRHQRAGGALLPIGIRTRRLDDRPAPFVVDFTALLLLGPRAGVIVCAAGAIVRLLGESPGGTRASETLLPLAAPLLALEAAAFTHLALGGTIGTFEWPWQGAPIAVAVCAYCLVTSAVAEIAVPLLSGRPFSKSWPAVVLDGYPVYLTAAGLAVVVAELVERQLWTVALVAIVPVYFIYGAYADHIERRDEEARCQDALASLDQACRWLTTRHCHLVERRAPTVARVSGRSRAGSGALERRPGAGGHDCRARCVRRRGRRSRCALEPGLPGPVARAWWTCASCPVPGLDMQWRDVTATWRASTASNAAKSASR
jgi:hypothetical protein